MDKVFNGLQTVVYGIHHEMKENIEVTRKKLNKVEEITKELSIKKYAYFDEFLFKILEDTQVIFTATWNRLLNVFLLTRFPHKTLLEKFYLLD